MFRNGTPCRNSLIVEVASGSLTSTTPRFAEGLAGNSIDEACKALVDALVAYFLESRRRLLGKAADKQKMIETQGLAAIENRLDDPNLVDRIVEDLERKLAVPTLSDSSSDSPASSESPPGPLTLRQLFQMAEAKRQHDWHIASSVMALTAEINRDRKSRETGSSN